MLRKEKEYHDPAMCRVLQYLHALYSLKEQVSNIHIEAYLAYQHKIKPYNLIFIGSLILMACLALALVAVVAFSAFITTAPISTSFLLAFKISYASAACAFLASSIKLLNTPLKGLDEAITEFELLVDADSQKNKDINPSPEEQTLSPAPEKRQDSQAGVKSDDSPKRPLSSLSFLRKEVVHSLNYKEDDKAPAMSRRNSF